MRKLTNGELRILKLIKIESEPDGWAPISKEVYPLVHPLPRRLIECKQFENGAGSARLTPEGSAVLVALQWL